MVKKSFILRSKLIVSLCTILSISFMQTDLSAQTVDHWETIIETGDIVKYLIPDSEVPADWNTIDFNDASWSEGSSGVGYGDDDDNTIIPTSPYVNSVYIRYRFTAPEALPIEQLILDMDFDDGFIAYLNGEEVARYNMGESFSPSSFNQVLDTDIEAQLYQGLDPKRFFIPENFIDSIIYGENVFAVEVHNYGLSSSDLSSNTFLHAGIANSNSFFKSTPHWFSAPINLQQKLPLMIINTQGKSIGNENRIVANMGLIYNGLDESNSLLDPLNVYDGKISIEIRGASSQGFPKKSYTIETQTDSGTNNNVSLLGLPKENDFVLYAPYSDKSLLRNVISYRLYEEMGHWSPRTRLINLYLNGDYQGIYVLTEKIKIDPWRINIKELSADDVSEIDISGGYILQVDRTDGLLSSEYWTTPAYSPYAGFSRNTFEYYNPKRDELTDSQATYIRDWMNNFDILIAGNSFDDETNGYRKYIDVPSFVDYFIFHEFNKDVDAYRLSTFFYKASDYNGGKLHAGPPWDYNLTYGNMNYGTNIKETYNWMYELTASKYWWKRLMEDDWFDMQVKCRWDELRDDFFDFQFIETIIDSSVAVMDESVDLNFEKWPVLGTYVWPNSFVGNTHEEEIDFLKNWIDERISWLDSEWLGECISSSSYDEVIKQLRTIKVYPNPSNGKLVNIQLPEINNEPLELVIYNIFGKEIYQERISDFSNHITINNLSDLPIGVYLIKVFNHQVSYSRKLIIE